MKKNYQVFILAAALFLSPNLLRADEGVKSDKKEQAENVEKEYRQKLREAVTEVKLENETSHELDYYFRYMPFSGAEHQSGKVSVVDTASEYNYDFKAFGKLPMQVGVIAQYVSLNNSTQVKLPAHLTGISFGVENTLPFFSFDKTYLRFGFAPSFYGDDWNMRSSNFRIPMRAFIIKQYNDKLTFVAGVSVRPDYEDDVLPIVGLIYKPNDRLSFNLVQSRPNITYDLNKKWSVFIEEEGADSEYEVNLSNAKNAVLKYNENHVGAGLNFHPSNNIHASISTGYVFSRVIKYKDENLGKVVLGNGMYTEFRLEISV